MTTSRRILWALTLTAFLVATTGCTSSSWLSINEELNREGSGLFDESGQAITGYQLNDGPETPYKGRVRLVAQDSLMFWQRETREIDDYDKLSSRPELIAGPTIPLDAMKSLKVEGFSGGKTVLGVLMSPLVIVGLALLPFLIIDGGEFK